MEWWEAVAACAAILVGGYGVAWALCWIFEAPGFERPRRRLEDLERDERPWGDHDA